MIINKLADHLPPYRGEDIFARAGMVIPRNTQFGMQMNIAMLVGRLVALMKSRVISGKVLGVDETTVRMQDASLPGKMRTAKFWLYRGCDDYPYNVFDFTETRGRAGPAEFLKDFSGHVVVDAYGVNDGVYLRATNKIFAACCSVHPRGWLSCDESLPLFDLRARHIRLRSFASLAQRDQGPIRKPLDARGPNRLSRFFG